MSLTHTGGRGTKGLGAPWLAALTLLLVPGVGIGSAEDFGVEASVSATRIGLDDDLQLTVSIHGDATGRAGSPELPSFDGFRVAGRSTSTSVQIINGERSSTRSVIYHLLPQAEGKHVIGPIRVDYQGEEHFTDPIEVEVVPGSVAPSPSPRRGSPDPFDTWSPFGRRRNDPKEAAEIFVTAELSKKEAFVGEQVMLTYKLYTQAPLLGLQMDREPSYTGFWAEKIPSEREPEGRPAEIDGKPFHVAEIRKVVLFPTRPGKLAIEPATFSMAVRLSGDPFDSFFLRASEDIRRSTKALTLDVKPLPSAGRPRDFSGAVGVFTLSAQLNKEQTNAGEPVTLSVVLEGKGNLRTLEPPEIPALPGFRVYDPKTEESLQATAAGFAGEKRWEYVLVPDAAGRHRLGPLDFTYFDPGEQRYVAVDAGPLTLEVLGASASNVVDAPRGRMRILQRDVRYLKPPPEELEERRPFHRSTLFYTLLALPILWNLGLMLYLRKSESDRVRAGVLRSRRAHRMARGRLKRAARLAREGSREFYEEVAAALYRYVADKFGVAASGLTTQSIDRLLEERAVPEDVREAYRRAVEAGEFARFTPGERTRHEMESLLEQAESAIVALEGHLS